MSGTSASRATGERQLNAWMRHYLEYAGFPFSGEVQQLEAEITKTCRPPLNLTMWRSPQDRAIGRSLQW